MEKEGSLEFEGLGVGVQPGILLTVLLPRACVHMYK